MWSSACVSGTSDGSSCSGTGSSATAAFRPPRLAAPGLSFFCTDSGTTDSFLGRPRPPLARTGSSLPGGVARTSAPSSSSSSSGSSSVAFFVLRPLVAFDRSFVGLSASAWRSNSSSAAAAFFAPARRVVDFASVFATRFAAARPLGFLAAGMFSVFFIALVCAIRLSSESESKRSTKLDCFMGWRRVGLPSSWIVRCCKCGCVNCERSGVETIRARCAQQYNQDRRRVGNDGRVIDGPTLRGGREVRRLLGCAGFGFHVNKDMQGYEPPPETAGSADSARLTLERGVGGVCAPRLPSMSPTFGLLQPSSTCLSPTPKTFSNVRLTLRRGAALQRLHDNVERVV